MATVPNPNPHGPSVNLGLRPELQTVRGSGQRILCVDDDEALIYVTERIVRSLGYQVTSFLNAREALESFRHRPRDFDLVITDLSMPVMSGPHFAAELRRIRADLPLLLSSGCVRPEDEAIAATLGRAEILLKPSTSLELGQAIRRLLGDPQTP